MTYEAHKATAQDIAKLAEIPEAARKRLIALQPPIFLVTSNQIVVGGIAFLPSAGFTVALNSETRDSAIRAAQAIQYGEQTTLHLAMMSIDPPHRDTKAFGYLLHETRQGLSRLIGWGASFDCITAVPTSDEERKIFEYIGFIADPDIPRIFVLSDITYFTGPRQVTA